MSESTPAVPADKTFRFYNKDQGADYAKVRPGYHPDLYKTIIEHHTSTGGQLDTVLDIGCGKSFSASLTPPSSGSENHKIAPSAQSFLARSEISKC